jgi:hypothetical protein
MVAMDYRNPFHAFTRYELRHVPAHLAESDQLDVFDHLLSLEYDGGVRLSNAWFEAKAESDGVTGYLADVAAMRRLAKDAAETDFALGRASRNIGRELRCLLLAASVRSQAAIVPPGVLGAFLSANIWRPDQALAYAAQQPPSVIAGALKAIAPHLPSELLEDALDMGLRQAAHEENVHIARVRQVDVIVALAQHLSEAAATRAVEVLSQISSSDENRAHAVAALAPRLPRNRFALATECAASIHAPYARAIALVALAAEDSEPHRIELLDDVSADLPHVGHAINEVVSKIVPLVSAASFDCVLSAMRAIADKWQSARALRALAGADLPLGLREDAARAAEEELPLAEDANRTVGLLSHIVDYRPSEIRATFDEELGLRMPREYALRRVEPVLSAARAYEDTSTAAKMLAALAAYCPPHDQSRIAGEAVLRAKGISDPFRRATTLAVLTQLLPDWPGLLDEALRTARVVEGSERAKAFHTLLEQLPPDLLPEALNAMTGHYIGDYSKVAVVLPRFPEDALGKVIAFARTASGWGKSLLLPPLIPRVPAADRADLLRELWHDGYVPGVLRELAQCLPDDSLIQLIRQTEAITDERTRNRCWEELCEGLPAGLLQQAFPSISRIGDTQERMSTLSTLLVGVRCDEQQTEVDRALSACLAVGDVAAQASAIAALSPLIGGGRAVGERGTVLAGRADSDNAYREALGTLVHALGDDERATVEFLTATAASLPETHLKPALDLALRTRSPDRRVEALLAIAPSLSRTQLDSLIRSQQAALPPDLFARLLAGVLRPGEGPPDLNMLQTAAEGCTTSEHFDVWPARALNSLLPWLTSRQRAASLRALLRHVKRKSPGAAAHVISDVAGSLEGSNLFLALKMAYSISDLGFRADALTALAPNLPAPVRAKVVRHVLDIASNSTWDRQFPGLAESAILAEAVPLLSDTQLAHRAIQIARGLPEGAPRAAAMIAIVRYGEGNNSELVAEALRSVRQVQHPREKLDDVLELLPYMPESQRYDVITYSLRNAVANVAKLWDSGPPPSLAPLVREVTLRQSIHLWGSLSDVVSSGDRITTLRQIGMVAEILHIAGAPDTVLETARAINDVGTWWP